MDVRMRSSSSTTRIVVTPAMVALGLFLWATGRQQGLATHAAAGPESHPAGDDAVEAGAGAQGGGSLLGERLEAVEHDLDARRPVGGRPLGGLHQRAAGLLVEAALQGEDDRPRARGAHFEVIDRHWMACCRTQAAVG